MPKLYSSDHFLKILHKHGFEFVSCKGSHIKFRKVEPLTLNVIIPAGRNEIPFGTFKSILRQSHLAKEDFKR